MPQRVVAKASKQARRNWNNGTKRVYAEKILAALRTGRHLQQFKPEKSERPELIRMDQKKIRPLKRAENGR